MTREEAIRQIENRWSIMDYGESVALGEALDMAIEALSVEPKTGRWIRVGYDIYECSLCHQNVMTKDIDCYSYCHGCGAKMEVKE